MLIVLTPPGAASPAEISIVQQLLDAGLELLQLRKPGMDRQSYESYIKAIDPGSHHRIVLHQHHDLAPAYGIRRLHLSQSELTAPLGDLCSSDAQRSVLSTSLHLATMPLSLPEYVAYAFLSPVFDSISKPGYRAGPPVMLPAKQERSCKLVALGGIDAGNCADERLHTFDGIALLGAIWTSSDPLGTFKNIQQKWSNLTAVLS